ncbi:uncharacterized protein [Penaeus vannamei]|uniref:uncharacterized protein n=1 Tax=Penaeus vannamei TaxID=6689 RepID=UPI00387F9EE0
MNSRTHLGAPMIRRSLRWAWFWAWVWAGVVCGTGGECPKPCQCKWRDGKETVSCPDAEFIDIPRGLDPSTQVLDLKKNNLQILPRDAFVDTGLVNLQKVWLNFCNLKHMDSGAFNKLANLVELDLSHNLLRAVPSEALKDVPGLRDLRLAHNHLETLLDAAFTPTPDLVRLDLSFNLIASANERAFRGLTRLEVLKLSGNKFTTLHASVVLPLVAIHELHMDGNPWHCDCALRPLREWMVERNVAFSEPPSCLRPKRLQDHHWQTLTLDEFVCVPKVAAVAPRVLAAHGENVSLACRIETDIDAVVTWLLGDRPLQNGSDSQRYRMLDLVLPNQATRFSNLTIAGAAPRDQGTYRCVAENKAGVVETNLTLQVSNEIAEVRLVTMDRVFMTGGLLSVVAVMVFILFLLVVLLFRKRQRGRRRGPETENKTETPQSSQGHASNSSESHPKLADYHIVPTNDIDEPSPLPTHSDKSWMLRDASVDDFPSTKELEKSNLYAESDQRRLQKPLPDRNGKQTSPSTVSYVEIPKSELAVTQDGGVEDRLHWKDQGFDSKEGLLRKGCGQMGSQLSMGSGGHYPDLLDLPYTQQQLQHLQGQKERGSPLQLLNSAYGTISRNPRGGYGGLHTSSTVEDHPYAESSFTLPASDRYRSASALNLALGEASSPDYTHRPPVRHQLSLPDSSPILTAHERTLRNLMAAHRADFPEGGAVGGVGKLDASSDPCRFEYHAAQLEKFLMEYRSLQEQLYRMKESYEAQQRAGSLSRIDTIPESGGGALDESPPPPAEEDSSTSKLPRYAREDPGILPGSILSAAEPLRSILKKRYDEGARALPSPYSKSAYYGDDQHLLFGAPSFVELAAAQKQYPEHDS